MQKKLSPWCKKAKIAMIQNDISVNDLAEELGCSRCYLSSTLNGKNTSIEIRRRISDCNRHDHKIGRCCESSDRNERNAES